MNFAMPSLTPALPEIFLLVALCAILILDLFVKSRSTTFMMTLAALFGTALVVCLTATSGITHTFSNMFVSDAMARVLKTASLLSVAVVLVYSRDYLDARGLNRGEFYTLSLFAVLGMMVMISANHFLTLYLGLELM